MVSRRIPSMSVPVTCETCAVTHQLENANDIDGSFRVLEGAGWMHFARKAVGRERWTWKCSKCKPQGKPQTSGLTTPGPAPSSKSSSKGEG